MMRLTRTAALTVLLAPGLVPGQFQPNQPGASLLLDGASGTRSTALRVVKSRCQPALVTLASEPRLVGQPMLILASPHLIMPAGHGAMQTLGGQWLGVDPAAGMVLPGQYRGRMHRPLELPGVGGLSLQWAVLDVSAKDGYRMSAPGRILVVRDAVVVARPQVFGGEPGRLQTMARSGESAPLTGAGATPTGLAFGVDGSTYFGRARTAGGLHIELFHRSREGVEKSLGIVVDTRGGGYHLGAQGFDLLRVGGDLVFTHPTVFGVNHSVRERGSIRALDLATGQVRTLVGGLDRPSGLAVDPTGQVYFGEVKGHPMRVDLYRRDLAGQVVGLGTAWDSAGASLSVGLWGFDLALRGDELVFQVPVLLRGTTLQRGRIEALDLIKRTRRTLATGSRQISGLSFDDQGGLYFAEVATAPARAQLFYRTVGGRIEDLGQIFECGVGQVSLGGWGLDLAVPCR